MKVKRTAKVLDSGLIEFKVDHKTIVTRAPRDSDYLEWPELERPEKPKIKRKRRKAKDDIKADAEYGASGDGI